MAYLYPFKGECMEPAELGNKGANIVAMTRLGLPVPPGFIVSIKAYQRWRDHGGFPDGEIIRALALLEFETDKRLGQGMAVSVRSSAPVSMPGMLDTVLNISNLFTLMSAIKRIFESWNTPRAIEYRRLNNISSTLGTAAIIQSMVYGNKNERSGTGVVFSRNPSLGDKGLYGEYMLKAQGEDLVSGSRTPEPISRLRSVMPEKYAELAGIVDKLERHFRDMQDIEFTIESGRLYILQTRNGKRTCHSAVKIAVEIVKEGLVCGQVD